jgi:O-succinylbenzoate synthase
MSVIERIHLYHLRMPLVSSFETSFGSIDTRDCILLQVFSEGIVGWGECVADRDPGYAYETSGTAWHILEDFILPNVIGQELSGPTELQSRLKQIRGHAMAKAGLEMALWDLAGKQQGKSLQAMLGGQAAAVPVGVSVGIQATPNALVKAVRTYLAAGYQRIKIKIKPGRDVEDIHAVRNAYPQILLQVDANSAYRLEDTESLKALDNYNLLLIEQPLAEDDLWDHHKLQAVLSTPICLDESIHSVRHARQAIEMQACRVINIKAGRVGGLSEAIAIHDLCASAGVPVWCGGMLETGVGRAANLALASLPQFRLPGDISATDRYYIEDVTEECFVLNADSTISVPQGNGLGVTINQAAMKKFTLRELDLRS